MRSESEGIRPMSRRALPENLQAFDRFEVGGQLVGREASGRAVGRKDPVPAAFEAVWGEGGGDGEFAGAPIKGRVASVGGGAGDDELRTDKKSIRIGSGGAE